MAEVRLTEWTSCGGCAAKWGAGDLRDIVSGLPRRLGAPDRLLIGLDPPDDAAVFAITDDVAWVSTTDFFPPLVDDPDDFGAIAAANACSDVLAMGADVRLALNIAAFPEDLPADAIRSILKSASDTVMEAGGVVAGGHTIRSTEPIFGLAVQGTVHPGQIWTKRGAVPGNLLVLSKPLGTGIALATQDRDTRESAVTAMRKLNLNAAEQLRALGGGSGPHSCTDVTGFGLIGHLSEVAERSNVLMEIDLHELPILDGVEAAALRGTRTGGDERNRRAFGGHVSRAGSVAAHLEAVAYDPQTSGGLLAAVNPGEAEELERLGWSVIGRVKSENPGVRLRG